jgi:hypothetical protein
MPDNIKKKMKKYVADAIDKAAEKTAEREAAKEAAKEAALGGIKGMTSKLKGDQPMMMPSTQKYYESDVEKAVKAQYKKAEEKNAELKKENLSAEELRKRGITVRQQ